MEALVQYHRSFVDVTNNATTKHNMWVGEQTYERQPVTGSVSGYQLLPKEMRPIDLYAKPGQNFRKYATVWEESCSPLAGWTNGTQMSPVVAQQETIAGFPVVAHYGSVRGPRIILPREHLAEVQVKGRMALQPLVDRGIPIYVTNGAYPRAGGWASIEAGSSLYTFHLLTDFEGRVLAEFGVSMNDDSITSVDPFLFLTVGQIVVSIGKGIGQKVVSAVVRKAEQRAVLRTLRNEMVQWGELMAHEASIAGWKRADLKEITDTMQRVMGQLIDRGTSTLKATNIRDLDKVLRQNGFKLFQAQPFGPQGGFQLFYRNGRVVGRVKTMGDAGGPRAGVTHSSFSVGDGWGLRWEHDIAKITREGKLAPKNIVSLDDWARNNMGGSQNIGSRNFWYVVRKDHSREIGDAWANSTHFNARPGFGLDGVQEIVRGAAK